MLSGISTSVVYGQSGDVNLLSFGQVLYFKFWRWILDLQSTDSCSSISGVTESYYV